jgi:hypothetical protein
MVVLFVVVVVVAGCDGGLFVVVVVAGCYGGVACRRRRRRRRALNGLGARRFLQLYPDGASAVVLDGVVAPDITRLVYFNLDVNVVSARVVVVLVVGLLVIRHHRDVLSCAGGQSTDAHVRQRCDVRQQHGAEPHLQGAVRSRGL